MMQTHRHRGFKSLAAFILVCVLASCANLAAQSSPAHQPTPSLATFRIAGTVVSASGGHPLARARVSVTDTKNPEKTESMITAEDGHFEFNHLPVGKYALVGAKKGFIPAGYDQHEHFSTAIVTGAGFDTESLTLRLAPSAVLSGRVLDESGEPVRHASVVVYHEDRRSGVSQIVRFRAESTDDRGSFEVTPLDSGTYFISVSTTPWYAVHPMAARPEATENLPVLVDRSLDVAYPTTYYADVTEADEATPIPLRGGDHVQIEIHLIPVPALHLLFRAPDLGKNGVTMPQLQERTFDSQDFVQTGGMQMVSPGLFEITGVPPGRYLVRTPGSPLDSSPKSGEVDLANNGQELEAPLSESGASVKASVRVVGAARLPEHLDVVLQNKKQRGGTFQPVNAQGEVEFHDLAPGQYTILAATPTQPYWVAQIKAQGIEVQGRTLNVPAGSSLTLSLSLIPGELTVEGFAKHDGKAVAGAMIVLVPKDPESNRELFRRDQSDLDGSFSLHSVIPGSYTVVAIENGWDLDWSQPGVIALYCQRGQNLMVDGRAGSSIHLPQPVEVQTR